MRRIARVLGGIGVAVMAAGCASNPPPTSLHGDAPGLEALRGQWAGEYWSEDTGRHGAIRFELSAAGDTARGEVVMIPAGRQAPLAYRDPRSGHRLVTTFSGRLSGDTIRGTYSSYDCEDGDRTGGDWRVTRR